MSATLEPVTRERLDQFRRRWRLLETTQGIAVALLMGLACLLLVIIVDASLVIPQSVRWLLSLTIYAALASCLVATALRIGRHQSLPSTAKHFEELDPRLHEQLLSAVELSQDSPANNLSSMSFRRRVQLQVAEAIEPVRVGSLLPWSTIARGVLAACVGIGLAVGLAWVPGLHWPHRVARALLPGANLGRISRFDIEILNPQPASTLLPGGAVAAVEARVRGPLPDSVWLETRIAGELDRLSMRGITRLPIAANTNNTTNTSTTSTSTDPSKPLPATTQNATAQSATAVELTADDLTYSANVTMGEQPIEYRIIAEDAQTPWYRLTSRPRPQVDMFHMQIVQPSYSQLPKLQRSSTEGDIEALRGSRIQLEILCNQAISQGWLQLSLAEATSTKKIELQPVPVTESIEDPAEEAKLVNRRFRAELAVDGDFSYRVHLESAETRFTNAFSPEYQVRAINDDPPRLTWVKPEANMLVVEPNQLISLAIAVEDELPLQDAMLITSVNGEPPITFMFDLPKDGAASPADGGRAATGQTAEDGSEAGSSEMGPGTLRGKPVTIATDLDLLQLKPRVGDTVRLAVQATDRAGQPAVSTPIELIVSSTAIDPQRRPATEQRVELAGELRRFAEQVQPQVKHIRELQEELVKLAPDSDLRPSKLEELKQSSLQLSEQAGANAKQLREKVAEHLKQSQDSVSLEELERTGQVLARIESQLSHDLSELSELVDVSSNAKADQQRGQINKLRSASEKIADAASVLDRRFREFVSHDVLSEVARGMSVVQDFQEQLAASSESETPAQLKRRQAVVARQLRELEQIMVDRSPLLREQAAPGLRGWIEWSGQLSERIERASNETDDNPNFKEFTKQVLAEVKQHQSVMAIDGALESEINNGRRELDARGESASSALVQLAKSALAALKASDAPVTPELRDEFARGLDQLQHRKELEQARGDSDAYHVSDLGNAIRATRQMLDQSPEQISSAQVQQLDKTVAAVKKLEAIHNVTEANKHLADLEQIERWNSNSIDARTESPRVWDAFKQRLEQASRALRDAGISPALVQQVDRIRNDQTAGDAGQKIQARRWSADAQASAQAELTEMRTQLDAARAQLDTIARAARVDLMEAAPSVPELARKAAEQTSQLQQETDKLSKAAAADEVPDLKSRLDQLAGDQQQATEPINDLRDALTEMAAVQDLLDDGQRAIAKDADTSQQIIDTASEQISESLKPAAEASNATAAAQPLEKAAKAQGEASAALEQIADHFERLQSGNLPEAELADSRQALQKMASDQEMAAMDEWYKTAESLSKLASGDPQQVLKKLEDELNRNARMREELSDISKQAVDESVKSLNYSADQERTLQSQLEQSDPAYAARKLLLQQDIQAANERMHQWMQQLSNDASSVAGRAGAREPQQRLNQLQDQLEQTIADASAAHNSLPLEDLQRVADAIVKSLEAAQKEFGSVADKLQPSTEEPVHASEQELRNRKREMEDWERRMLQQQSRGAQSVVRSHEQRARQAKNATSNAESLNRNAQRSRDDLEKQAKAKPENADLAKRLLEVERQVLRSERELQLAKQRETALKDRLAVAKQAQQEMSARKTSELKSQNPTAELATRLARTASSTSEDIAAQLKKALADTGWMSELAVAQNQLQSGEQQQGRVEQSVGGVAGNLERAARHEERLEHPKAAERIGQQAARVSEAKEAEVHSAQEQLATAAAEATASALAHEKSTELKDTASSAASLAARQAVSAAESELRARVRDLKAMLEQPQPEEPGAAKDEAIEAPAEPSVPLDPKMLARMLDELDRQMSEAASDQPEEPNEGQPSSNSENGKSEDENNQSSSQQASPSNQKKKGSQTASMQDASQQLAEQMNKQRAQNRQSTASSRMTSNTADTKAAPPSSVRVMSVDRRSGEDWGKLREQAAEQTIESARQNIAPQYRNSVETYFRVLSERGHGK
ncbi:MAG: hypothetical protein IT423_10775 [Pirellulaceae bacterium]|nr:hypothetical protein [Pirellulaceae bacterium]